MDLEGRPDCYRPPLFILWECELSQGRGKARVKFPIRIACPVLNSHGLADYTSRASSRYLYEAKCNSGRKWLDIVLLHTHSTAEQGIAQAERSNCFTSPLRIALVLVMCDTMDDSQTDAICHCVHGSTCRIHVF